MVGSVLMATHSGGHHPHKTGLLLTRPPPALFTGASDFPYRCLWCCCGLPSGYSEGAARPGPTPTPSAWLAHSQYILHPSMVGLF
jgi:hypothetical protein